MHLPHTEIKAKIMHAVEQDTPMVCLIMEDKDVRLLKFWNETLPEEKQQEVAMSLAFAILEATKDIPMEIKKIWADRTLQESLKNLLDKLNNLE